AGLGRLLGDRQVREDVDPDLAAALDAPRHGDPGGLDLAVGDPRRLERLEPVLPEVDHGVALREPLPAAAVVLAELDALGHQHGSALPCVPAAAASATVATAPAVAAFPTATAAAAIAPAAPRQRRRLGLLAPARVGDAG